MVDRLIGVLKLDANTYEEIEHDKGATTQAGIVVVVVAVLGALGALLGGDSILSALVGPILGWVVWSAVTFFIGTKLFGGKADIYEMLRVLGFATAPNALAALSFIPFLGWIAIPIAFVWSLACGFVAVRQGLDLDNTKSLITIVLSFIPAAILIGFLGTILGFIGL